MLILAVERDGDACCRQRPSAWGWPRVWTWRRPAGSISLRTSTSHLWLGCEIAVVACNLAEVLGMACGLALSSTSHLPVGVCITAARRHVSCWVCSSRGVRQFESSDHRARGVGSAPASPLQIWWLQPVPRPLWPPGLLPTSTDPVFTAEHAVSGSWHHWSHGDATQPVPAFVHWCKTRQHDRCDARYSTGYPLCDPRLQRGARICAIRERRHPHCWPPAPSTDAGPGAGHQLWKTLITCCRPLLGVADGQRRVWNRPHRFRTELLQLPAPWRDRS